MKNYNIPEGSTSGITVSITGQPPDFLENMSRTGPGSLCTKPAIILKLYGMSLIMDETNGKLIITNSILKNVPAGKFIQVVKNAEPADIMSR